MNELDKSAPAGGGAEAAAGRRGPKPFRRWYPWALALAALIGYALTLNHWLTINSLPIISQLNGWDWRPNLVRPVLFLVTLPCRLFSGNAELLAMNFLAAVLAAAVLGVLARSVMLLPQDRTRDQRWRLESEHGLLNGWEAWVPPLLAVLALGMGFTFWEHAVAGTGEMLDLLLFALPIWCLLEYRIKANPRWLWAMALLYGVGITNNWAMIPFLPLFLVAVVWVAGKRLLDRRLILGMAGLGLAGLTLYLVMPVAAMAAGDGGGFVENLRVNLGFQKNFYFNYPFVQFTGLRGQVLLISMSSLLPLLLLGVRWPASYGEMNPLGNLLTDWMFRLTHLFFLVIGLWVSFDPKFSARVLGYGLWPFLSFYYLTALCVGYLAGYLLVVFGRAAHKSWMRDAPWLAWLKKGVPLAVALSTVILPGMLLRKNLPEIQVLNGPFLRQYSQILAQSLPEKGGVVLSDDANRTLLAQAGHVSLGRPQQNLLLDTGLLTSEKYQAFLRQRYPAFREEIFSESDVTNGIHTDMLLGLMLSLSQKHELYYMHPSFGYYFEHFQLRPRGILCRLVPYPEGELGIPPLSPEEIEANQTFWADIQKPLLEPLARAGDATLEARMVSSYYAKALNHWGVELQRLGLIQEAARKFDDALVLNPENITASLNLDFNARLQAGTNLMAEPDEAFQKKVGQIRNWEQALNVYGPVDDIRLRLQVGQALGRGGNLRQSAQQFQRVLELDPRNIEAHLFLATTFIDWKKPDEALKLLDALKARPDLSEPHRLDQLRIESFAWLARNDASRAERTLRDAIQEKPKDASRLDLLTQFFIITGRYTNAIELLDRQATLKPDDVSILIRKGALHLRLDESSNAVQTLTKAIEKDANSLAAWVNRGIANLQLGKLDDAQSDYKMALTVTSRDVPPIFYGLGEVAWRRKETSAALDYYRQYVKCAPAGTSEYQQVTNRIHQLESGKAY